MPSHTLGLISVFRNHFFEMLLTLLERDWLSDKDTLSLVEEHVIVEAETIKEAQDTLIFPRGFHNLSQVRVAGQELLGRTYQGVLLRGEFLASLYESENQIQATISDILYFGFLDQNETSVSLDFHYTDDEESVFDSKSRCLVLQEVGDEVFDWTDNFCNFVSENTTDVVCQCQGITNTLNYAGFRSGLMTTSTTSTSSVEPTMTSTTTPTSTTSPATSTNSSSTPTPSTSTSQLSTDPMSTSTSSDDSCQWTFSKTLLITSVTFLSIALIWIFIAFFAILVFFK